MNISDDLKASQRNLLYCVILILLAPALLINLGLMTFIDDEAIRALVALEMDFSGNYIVPTINGDYYYNKPPLYNWYLLLWFNLFGDFNEFVSRFASVFSLLAYAGTIFYFTKKHYSTKFAFLNALFLLTCGRILIYDSLLSLIDITYSWLTFLSFMLIYHHYEKKKYYALFILSYTLAALCFLMKGLPSIVFQGATLLAFFTYKKDFKRLFTLPHILGAFLFVLLVGAYYLVYNQYNSLETVFETLAVESSKRTASQYGIGQTIKHLFTFPLEIIYHFLPWTILVIYLFKKNIKQTLQADPFIVYCTLIFFANILVYWISVEVYPRYLFMHLPLLFTVFLYLHFKNEKENNLYFKIITTVLTVFCLLLCLAMFAPLFLERTQHVSFLYLKVAFLGGLSSLLFYILLKYKNEKILLTVALLLVARIAFNWFVLPDRYAEDWGTKVKTSSIEVGQQSKGTPLFIYKKSVVNLVNSFYISREAKQIIRYKDRSTDPNEAFLFNPLQYGEEIDYQKIGSFVVRYKRLNIDVIKNVQLKKNVEE